MKFKDYIKNKNDEELKNLIKLYKIRIDMIKTKLYIKELVPKIFQKHVKLIKFESTIDHDKYHNLNDYNELSSTCYLKIQDLKMTIEYATGNLHDWSDSDEDEDENDLNICIEHEATNHSATIRGNKIKISQYFLKILDICEIPRNDENQYMLGILFNNIFNETRLMCNPDGEYSSSNISQKEISESITNKKRLIKIKYT